MKYGIIFSRQFRGCVKIQYRMQAKVFERFLEFLKLWLSTLEKVPGSAINASLDMVDEIGLSYSFTIQATGCSSPVAGSRSQRTISHSESHAMLSTAAIKTRAPSGLIVPFGCLTRIATVIQTPDLGGGGMVMQHLSAHSCCWSGFRSITSVTTSVEMYGWMSGRIKTAVRLFTTVCLLRNRQPIGIRVNAQPYLIRSNWKPTAISIKSRDANRPVRPAYLSGTEHGNDPKLHRSLRAVGMEIKIWFADPRIQMCWVRYGHAIFIPCHFPCSVWLSQSGNVLQRMLHAVKHRLKEKSSSDQSRPDRLIKEKTSQVWLAGLKLGSPYLDDDTLFISVVDGN